MKKSWEVCYMPGEDNSNTRYFETEEESKSYWESKVRNCNLCGKGKWCDALSVEWGYSKI